MELNLNDILELKKEHPCGSKRWQVLRVGMDIKLRCMGCGHEVMQPRRKVEKMLENRLDYRYSIKGLALCKLGIEEEREGHYFCSQFVGEVLEDSGVCALPKPPSLMRPQDYASLPGARCVFEGSLYRLAELSRAG